MKPIIPTPHNEPNQAIRQANALLEELNVVRVEGRYFCFDKHALKARVGVLQYRDGNRGTIIETSRHGHPSGLAYKVLQAAFRKVTLEGRPFPDTISFSYRELARLIGRDVIGGQDAKEIFRAIRQLEDTKIELVLYRNDAEDSYQSIRFSMFAGTGFIAEGDELSPRKIRQAVLTLHPFVMNSMRKGHFAVFNWERVSALEPLTAALYKRLYLHLSNLYEEKYNRDTLKFEKDYEDLCGEWLGGLKPQGYRSLILQQLGSHLDTLKSTGIIRGYSLERKADGGGWKVVFRPGAAFFRDYELFYLGSRARVLQFQQSSDQHEIQRPYELAKSFYTKLHGRLDNAEGIISAKDADFAKGLLERFGEEAVRDLIDFAIAEAPRTQFRMQSFRAVETFLPKWQASRDVREETRKRAEQVARKQAEDRLRTEYDEVIRAEVFRHMEALSVADRDALRSEALASLSEDLRKPETMGHGLLLQVAERRILRDRLALPSFEAWLESKQ
ncbi:MAG: hypothetical protein OMOMHJEC_03314 [Xanthomonadales bacterium]|nr:hypothetical protein [Xanthomonadales bacterium]